MEPAKCNDKEVAKYYTKPTRSNNTKPIKGNVMEIRKNDNTRVKKS